MHAKISSETLNTLTIYKTQKTEAVVMKLPQVLSRRCKNAVPTSQSTVRGPCKKQLQIKEFPTPTYKKS